MFIKKRRGRPSSQDKRILALFNKLPVPSQCNFEEWFDPEKRFPEIFAERDNNRSDSINNNNEEKEEVNAEDQLNNDANNIMLAESANSFTNATPIIDNNNNVDIDSTPKSSITTTPIRLRITTRSAMNNERPITFSPETPSKPPRKRKIYPLDEKEEEALLSRLEHAASIRPLNPKANRLKRKLLLRKWKRNLGLENFDIDSKVSDQMRSSPDIKILVPIESREEEDELNDDNYVNNVKDEGSGGEKNDETASIKESEVNDFNHNNNMEKKDEENSITNTPYKNSFASRLYGNPRLSSSFTSLPYIYRDYETIPPKLKLLNDIVKYANRNDPDWIPPPSYPIDYCYFQKEHLNQVNDLLQKSFWPEIEVSENLQFPEFSVIALYKRLVIGCGFMTPETNIGNDIKLQVSTNNPTTILYQKLRSKPEEFIINFHDDFNDNKHLITDDGSLRCKNAFFVRFKR
nr:1037_t:CDS:2 [Entrophospora candida]